MKSYTMIFLLSLMLMACSREEISNGYVEVKALSHGTASPQTQIYLRRGVDTSIISIMDTFDRQTTTDGDGLAYFRDLAPDTYTIIGRSYCSVDQRYTYAWAILTIRNKARSNGYDISLYME